MDTQKPLPKNLEVNLDQFIGTFKNAFEPEYCQRAIKYFERMDEMGFGYSRVQLENAPSHLKDTISYNTCLLYTSPSPRDRQKCRMPSSA